MKMKNIIRKDFKGIEPMEQILFIVSVTMLALLGIGSLVGFILTGMWHCLLVSVMCAGLIWAWYTEDYTSETED